MTHQYRPGRRRMASKRWVTIALLIGFVTMTAIGAAAQEPFYRGKTIRIVVGFTAGGGFDAYSRALARHMPRHIPGNPTIVVENMPGAGSLISANYLYKIAKPDGLTIGHFIGGLLLGQVLGQKGVEFDARKFEYIGAPVYEHPVCATTVASGITSLEKWMASPTPVKMGGVAPGASNPDNITRAARATIGLPTQIVTGYKGTAEIRLAAESGELAGRAGAGARCARRGARASTPGKSRSCCRSRRSRIPTFPTCRWRSPMPRPTRRAASSRWPSTTTARSCAPTRCRPARPKIACRSCARRSRRRCAIPRSRQ